jgi:hypothetical protein
MYDFYLIAKGIVGNFVHYIMGYTISSLLIST